MKQLANKDSPERSGSNIFLMSWMGGTLHHATKIWCNGGLTKLHEEIKLLNAMALIPCPIGSSYYDKISQFKKFT